jgi:predicted phage replisome organizer/uncharacterized phage protein (TIGR02220 family)
MTMAEVKWIKIVTDVFDDEKVILIESMPEADSIIVIWFKLLCLAGKQNRDGLLMLNDKIAYTDEMLATVFRRPINTVRLALNTFEKFAMIEIVDGTICIANWERHQNANKLAELREYNRIAQQKSRARRKLLPAVNDSQENVNDSQCTDIEEDKEKEKDKEKKKRMCAEIVSHLNEKAGTAYRAASKATQSHINARLSEGYSLEDFFAVIDKKCEEWKGTDMEKYLRPETLFGSKFENYLNAPTSKRTDIRSSGIAVKQNASDDLDGIF